MEAMSMGSNCTVSSTVSAGVGLTSGTFAEGIELDRNLGIEESLRQRVGDSMVEKIDHLSQSRQSTRGVGAASRFFYDRRWKNTYRLDQVKRKPRPVGQENHGQFVVHDRYKQSANDRRLYNYEKELSEKDCRVN